MLLRLLAIAVAFLFGTPALSQSSNGVIFQTTSISPSVSGSTFTGRFTNNTNRCKIVYFYQEADGKPVNFNMELRLEASTSSTQTFKSAGVINAIRFINVENCEADPSPQTSSPRPAPSTPSRPPVAVEKPADQVAAFEIYNASKFPIRVIVEYRPKNSTNWRNTGWVYIEPRSFSQPRYDGEVTKTDSKSIYVWAESTGNDMYWRPGDSDSKIIWEDTSEDREDSITFDGKKRWQLKKSIPTMPSEITIVLRTKMRPRSYWRDYSTDSGVLEVVETSCLSVYDEQDRARPRKNILQELPAGRGRLTPYTRCR